MLWKILFGVSLVIAHQFCYCDEHTVGFFTSDKLLFEKELFNQVKDEGDARPRNYTLIFKYINTASSPDITYAVFNVQNAKSYGKIERIVEDDKTKTLQATLSIVNGTNFIVTGKVYGPHVTTRTYGPDGILGMSKRIPKTMTVVYAHNTTQTRNHIIVLGQRQQPDEKLDFQTKIVKYKYRFAEEEFRYPRSDTDPAHASITAVEFSFSTPTAVAFINSTFISEHKIDAIVYDLNFPEFEANMTVYGFRWENPKPQSYKPIVLTGKNALN